MIEFYGKVVWKYMGVEPKIGVCTPQIMNFNRVWNHYKPSILGYPYFGNTHIPIMDSMGMAVD